MNFIFKNKMVDSNDVIFATAGLILQQYTIQLTKLYIQKHFAKIHEVLTLTRCAARKKSAFAKLVRKVAPDYSTNA